MAQKQVIDKIKSYINVLKKNNINVYKVILFGSHVLDSANEFSDIDVAIISLDLGKNYLQEMKTLMKLARDIDLMISPDPYSLQAYENAKKGEFLWQEIIQKGESIDI